jgi:RNA polymerase sigma factor (sigma-70 family)
MEKVYKKLLTYSYNIVGSYDDAKDLVHDVLEKYIEIDKSHIQNESNFLIKSTINHSINFKNRQSRKVNFGVWLPQPVSTENPDSKIIKEQTANYSLLVLMEYLNPKERAVFILKEGFDYSHEEIADLLDITIENSRKLLSRARKQLNQSSFNSIISNEEVIDRYQKAIVSADIKQLESMLVEDIKLMADGGTKIRVIKDIETGVTAAARLLHSIQKQFLKDKKYSFHVFNHQPAICFWDNDILYNCQILNLDKQGRILQIYSVVDPEKLKSIVV